MDLAEFVVKKCQYCPFWSSFWSESQTNAAAESWMGVVKTSILDCCRLVPDSEFILRVAEHVDSKLATLQSEKKRKIVGSYES